MSITINTDDFKAIVNNDPVPNTSGFFVELMTSINAYVKGEFNSGRITGTEYATVYLGAMQSAIAQAVQYASQKATSDAQAALLTAQKAQVEAETNKVVVEISNATKQGTILDKQALELDKDITLKDAQILQINTEISKANAETAILVEKLRGETYTVDHLMPAQLDESTAKVASIHTEIAKIVAETSNIPKQGTLIDAQVNKLVQENLLVAEQVITEHNKRDLLDAQRNDTNANLAVKAAEVTKLNTEVSLTQAKVLTEAAQPDAVIATTELTRAKAATEISNRDSLAAQTILYKTQAAAFKGKQSLDAVSKMIDGVTMITTSKVPGAEISAAELAMFGNSSAIQSAMNTALTFPDIDDGFMHVYTT
jgi:hypothetical protein